MSVCLRNCWARSLRSSFLLACVPAKRLRRSPELALRRINFFCCLSTADTDRARQSKCRPETAVSALLLRNRSPLDSYHLSLRLLAGPMTIFLRSPFPRSPITDHNLSQNMPKCKFATETAAFSGPELARNADHELFALNWIKYLGHGK